MMRGLELGQDRYDGGIGLAHGFIHLFMEGLHLGLEIVARRSARFTSRFHLGVKILFLGAEGRIGGNGRIVRLLEFRFFSILSK
jgi:hypothetical protein